MMARDYKTLASMFTILSKYSEDRCMIDAQHDILYLAHDRIVSKISEEDMTELKRLGASVDSEGYLYIFT